MSDVVRVRIGGVEKNMNRSLALATDGVLVLAEEPIRRLDGRIRADEPVLATTAEGTYDANKADLEAELYRRNKVRDADHQLDAKKGTVKDLEAALVADDKARAKASDAARAAFAEARSAAAQAAPSDAGGSSADADPAGTNTGGTS